MTEYAVCRSDIPLCGGAMVFSKIDKCFICLKCGHKFSEQYVQTNPIPKGSYIQNE